MCGIAGIYNFDWRPVIQPHLKVMTDSMQHRGPDGEGFYTSGNVGIGHRRLSILDLKETGHQPMSYASGRYWIIYNGEIYNFIEIRNELKRLGHVFHSDSDTEVILAAYAEWKEKCLFRFNGMWAFAIWDEREKSFFLARDRFGVKPLFYYNQTGQFAFASEIKALIALGNYQPSVNEAMLCRFLYGTSISSTYETLYENIYFLEPGTYTVIRASGMEKPRRWWNTWENLPDIPRKKEEQIEQYRELLNDAIRIRLRSDVPLASLLSGGMDSSAIVCTINSLKRTLSGAERLAPDWQRTFTAEYPGLSSDEGYYARKVIEKTGANAIMVRPGLDDLPSFVSGMVQQQDSPVGQSLLAVHTVYREVGKSGIKVTLDGQGADEALSGYEAMTAARHYLKHFNFHQMDQALGLQAAMWGSQRIDTSQFVKTELKKAVRPRKRLRSLLGINATPDLQEPVWGFPSKELIRKLSPDFQQSAANTDGTLDKELYNQFHATVLPGILHRFDHAAMAYSVESRMPFLDWRLVTYTFALPEEMKVFDGENKYVLRRAMEGVVPSEVLNRKSKMGFPVPKEWFSEKRFREWVLDVSHSTEHNSSRYWNQPGFITWFLSKDKEQLSLPDLNRVIGMVSTLLWLRKFM